MRNVVLGGRNVRVVAAASAVALTLGLAPAVANPLTGLAPAAQAQTAGDYSQFVSWGLNGVTVTNLPVQPGATGTFTLNGLPAGVTADFSTVNWGGLPITVTQDGNVFTFEVADTAEQKTYTISGAVGVTGIPGISSLPVSGTINVTTDPTDVSAVIEGFVASDKCTWVGGSGFVQLSLTGDVPTIAFEAGGGTFPGTLTYTNNAATNTVRADWTVPADAAPGDYTVITNVIIDGQTTPVTTNVKVVENQADCPGNGNGGGDGTVGGGSLGDLVGNLDLGSLANGGGDGAAGSLAALTGALGSLGGDNAGSLDNVTGSLNAGSLNDITGSLNGGQSVGNLGGILLPIGLLALGGLAIGALLNAAPGSVALPFPIPGMPAPVPAPAPQPEPAPAPGPIVDNGRG